MNVLRKNDDCNDVFLEDADAGAEVEFLSLVESCLLDGRILNMAVLQNTFEHIRSENNVTDFSVRRKDIKSLIVNEIPGVEFHKPIRKNEPEQITLKCSRDNAINFSTASQIDHQKNQYEKIFLMRLLF